jgi:hypothetical protein
LQNEERNKTRRNLATAACAELFLEEPPPCRQRPQQRKKGNLALPVRTGDPNNAPVRDLVCSHTRAAQHHPSSAPAHLPKLMNLVNPEEIRHSYDNKLLLLTYIKKIYQFNSFNEFF